jgi:hypothetical protein
MPSPPTWITPVEHCAIGVHEENDTAFELSERGDHRTQQLHLIYREIPTFLQGEGGRCVGHQRTLFWQYLGGHVDQTRIRVADPKRTLQLRSFEGVQDRSRRSHRRVNSAAWSFTKSAMLVGVSPVSLR